MSPLADQRSRIVAELERSECGELRMRRGLPLACGLMCFVSSSSYCNLDFCVSHGGKSDVSSHVSSRRHRDATRESSSSLSISSFCQPKRQQKVTAAEARWALFTLNCSR